MKPKNPTKNPISFKNVKWILFIVAVVFIITLYLILGFNKTEVKGKSNEYNLLIITLDTTRADRIGAYGYKPAQTPNIDKMAGEGILFEHCYSPVPLTLPAHSSIFTGKYPLGHQTRDNGTYYLNEKQVTLAETMKNNGFQTFAVVASYVLLSKFGLKQGFDYYDDSLNVNEMVTDFDSEINAEEVFRNFNRWFLRENTKNKKNLKFFAWLHFYDPHMPYDAPSPFKEKFGKHPEGLYSAELAYMDSYIGKVIDTLTNAEVLNKTIIVLVGDHGEGFGEHLEYGHSIFCYEESLHVPLIIYNKKLFSSSKRILQRVNLVDIMPSLLEMYGLDKPQNLQGKSFINLIEGKKEKINRTFYFESMHGKEENGWAPLTGIIQDNYKYISLPEPELYDLATDPLEKNNLFWKKNRLARSFDTHLLELVKQFSIDDGENGSQLKLTESDKKHLQTLGYISAFENSEKDIKNIDPKKGIALDSLLSQVEIAIKQDQLENALDQLNQISKKYPKLPSPQYFGLLKTIYEKKGDMDGVIDTWKKAIEAFPTNSNFKINLAFQYFQLNHLEEAEVLAQKILEENSQYTKAYILLGRIRERQEKFEDSITYFAKADELEPKNVSLKIGYAKVLGRNGNINKAAQICEELLANDSVMAEPSVKNRIGIILTEIGKNDLAFKVLLEVKDSGKTDAETWNYLGILYFRSKQFEDASSSYIKSIEMDPKIAKTYNNLGTLYLTAFTKKRESKIRDMAMKAFNKALELEPTLISALNGRAAAYKFNNQVRDALTDWKTVISYQPNYMDAYINVGITYLELKEKREALKYLQIAKEKFYSKLPSKEQQRLDRLIMSAGG